MDTVLCNAVRSVQANLEMLGAYATALLLRSFLKVFLFQTATPITPTTPLSALLEATYSGYSRLTVTAFNGPALDAAGNAYVTSGEFFFTNNGGGVGNQIYSAAIVANVVGGVQATGTVLTNYGVISGGTVTGGGSGYLFPPTVTVLGGGTGAIVTASLTNGVVTGLTVVNGGTGYTGATLVIDPPLEIIAGQTQANASPMNVATDALPLVVQITVPPANT